MNGGKRYKCIVADPPWPETPIGKFKRRNQRPGDLPYNLMSLDDIKALRVEPMADDACHLWLWTTNRYLRSAFEVMDAWGFTYLNTVTWVKPSGFGAWFVNTTQHCLFGYYKKCRMRERYLPTHFQAVPKEHSAKPAEFYKLVCRVSFNPRIDLFNRRIIGGFDGWGDESPTPLQGVLLQACSSSS